MRKWLVPIGITVLGLIVAVAGLLYGAITVGVPHIDPTPDQAAAEEFNLAISSWGVGAGALLFLAGMLLTVILGIVHLLRRSPRRVP